MGNGSVAAGAGRCFKLGRRPTISYTPISYIPISYNSISYNSISYIPISYIPISYLLPNPHLVLAEVPLRARLKPRAYLGIQMADALFRLVAHPLAVIAHVLGQPLRTFPGARK